VRRFSFDLSREEALLGRGLVRRLQKASEGLPPCEVNPLATSALEDLLWGVRRGPPFGMITIH
jgi:hypothetical protein